MMRETARTTRTIGAVAGSLVLLAGLAGPARAAEAGTLTCRYVVGNTWRGGFNADLAITNGGPAIDGWTVRWSFQEETTNVHVWAATMIDPSSTHSMAFTNAAWNGRLATGGATTFGWTAQAMATEVPTDITVNGVACPTAG